MIYVGYTILILFLIMCLYTISFCICEMFRTQYVDNRTGVIYYPCSKFIDENGKHFILQSSKDCHYTTVSEEVLKERFNKK
jgi:hypothetical protein